MGECQRKMLLGLPLAFESKQEKDMRRGRASWYAFSPDNFLVQTRVMSLAEAGAYIQLLCQAFLDSHCSLPSDDEILARILHVRPREWSKVKGAVLEKFELRDGRLYDDELREEKKLSEEKIATARAKAEARWSKRDGGSPSPSTPIPKTNPNERVERTNERTTTTTERIAAYADVSAEANAAAYAEQGGGGEDNSLSLLSLLESKRPWLMKIWYRENCAALRLRGTEAQLLDELFRKQGNDERLVGLAWYSFVTSDPKAYHLEPVEVACLAEGKTGKKWVTSAEDQSSITKFPLLVFLRAPDTWFIHAKHVLEESGYELEQFHKVWEKAQ